MGLRVKVPKYYCYNLNGAGYLIPECLGTWTSVEHRLSAQLLYTDTEAFQDTKPLKPTLNPQSLNSKTPEATKL